MPSDPRRVRVDVRGVVQGVGFRPFIVGLATTHGLSGHVENNPSGVALELEGPSADIDACLSDLHHKKPPLALLLDVRCTELPAVGSRGMEIRPSQGTATREALLPPDACVCEECLSELRDPHNRRFRYPFIACTHCGPRYTIIDDIPHDRANTTMARFPLCGACAAEYHDPQNRRFHAQPNACPVCGPRVWLLTPGSAETQCSGDAGPVRAAAELLAAGQIVAIKGLGGFHLAVDASNAAAVRRLRERKRRDEKPLAVMCRDLDEARCHAFLDDATCAVLTSVHRPIVIVRRHEPGTLAADIAPGTRSLGIFLPYTPLHVVLLDLAPAALVMTSGNLSDEPMVITNDEALATLSSVADAFLMHDRDILLRNDDSIVRMAADRPRLLRRSRGYVPLPVMLSTEVPTVLAVGAELKSTVCVTRGRLAFVSQHLGDLTYASAVEAFEPAIARFLRILNARPEAIACDTHPDYASSRWALDQGLPLIRVQHHHAHVMSCAAEHAVEEPVLGLALDGAGLGTDGTIWGGEILVADRLGFTREGYLGCVRLPGGDRAAQQPFRMALSHLHHAFSDDLDDHLPPALRALPEERRRSVLQLVRTGTAAPWTSSVGRLFDAIASLCGLTQVSSFEAQAAMAVEAAAEGAGPLPSYPVGPQTAGELVLVDPADLTRAVVYDLERGTPVGEVARRFHRTLAVGFAEACSMIRARRGSLYRGGLATVALSGGCMSNRILAEDLMAELGRRGFRVISHEQVPAGDGGLSLGQAVIAAARLGPCRLRSHGP